MEVLPLPVRGSFTPVILWRVDLINNLNLVALYEITSKVNWGPILTRNPSGTRVIKIRERKNWSMLFYVILMFTCADTCTFLQLIWAFLIICCPSSIRPSVRLSVCPFVYIFFNFVFFLEPLTHVKWDINKAWLVNLPHAWATSTLFKTWVSDV